MESRIMILFCMLLSLFLLFSAASALLTALRRKWCRRMPSVVWGVLFLLPLLPFSLTAPDSPAQLVLTIDAGETHVVSLLPAEAEKEALPAVLTAAEDGHILYTAPDVRLPSYEHPAGLSLSTQVWSAVFYLTAFTLFLWLTLAMAFLTHRICAYAESIRYLTSRSSICHDERVSAVFQAAAACVKLHRRPQLRIVDEGIHLSPCTAGFLSPTVYISHEQASMASDALEYIFLHELCHVKRHDFLLKALALLTTSFHFFAPFAGTVRRQVYEDCELGCDRMVLSHIGISRRSRYMQTILDIAEQKVRGDHAYGELFSYASGAKELLMRRYRNLLEPEKPPTASGKLRLTGTLVLIILLHLGLFSTVDPTPIYNPRIRFDSPFLEAVVREYTGLRDDEPVTAAHLDGIWSLEFSFSRKTDRPSPANGSPALCCMVNEGKYYIDKSLSGEEWAVILQQDGLADGITPAFQSAAEAEMPPPEPSDIPVWQDLRYDCTIDLLPDVCPLETLERYLPEDPEDCRLLLSRYTVLDGTEAALDRYASEIYMDVIRENKLEVTAPEEEIWDAFLGYCQNNGIVFDSEHGSIVEQLRRHRREEIAALSPSALIRPMVFLDPSISGEDTDVLLSVLAENGITDVRYLPDMLPDNTGRYVLELADLTHFTGLRTVILNDRLILSDKTALTAEWCAVIER